MACSSLSPLCHCLIEFILEHRNIFTPTKKPTSPINAVTSILFHTQLAHEAVIRIAHAPAQDLHDPWPHRLSSALLTEDRDRNAAVINKRERLVGHG